MGFNAVRNGGSVKRPLGPEINGPICRECRDMKCTFLFLSCLFYRYCGNDLLDDTLVSETNFMVFKFVTNGSWEYEGYEDEVTCI